MPTQTVAPMVSVILDSLNTEWGGVRSFRKIKSSVILMVRHASSAEPEIIWMIHDLVMVLVNFSADADTGFGVKEEQFIGL